MVAAPQRWGYNEDFELIRPEFIARLHNDVMKELNNKVNIVGRDNAAHISYTQIREQMDRGICLTFKRGVFNEL